MKSNASMSTIIQSSLTPCLKPSAIWRRVSSAWCRRACSSSTTREVSATVVLHRSSLGARRLPIEVCEARRRDLRPRPNMAAVSLRGLRNLAAMKEHGRTCSEAWRDVLGAIIIGWALSSHFELRMWHICAPAQELKRCG
jgi:hypothetical protein